MLMARCCCFCGGGGSTGAAVAMLRLRLSPRPSPRPSWACCSRSLALTAISIDGYSRNLGSLPPGNRVVLLQLVLQRKRRWMTDRSPSARCVCVAMKREGGREGAAFKEHNRREIISGVMMA